MAVKIPEFILSGMFVRGSLRSTDSGFVFSLRNTYAPATILGFGLEVAGRVVPPGSLTLSLEGAGGPRAVDSVTEDRPFPLPVDTLLEVRVHGAAPEEVRLRIHVNTREVGMLSFSIRTEADAGGAARWPAPSPLRLFARPLRARAEVTGAGVIGEVQPEVYGHFVEHLERCVYDGIWDTEGHLRGDVVDLVREMRPPVIRYPGGNFASDYHWEEGIGPRENRPVHYDRAWHVEDPNLVGTDEFMEFCRAAGAEPYLVVNDGSGTPEEAARWVEYCNGPAGSPMGARRAANGHPEPYGVRYWGLGNEIWGEWQIGHTDARGYVDRIIPFIDAMRAVDPGIRLVAVGLDHLDGDPRGAAEWNGTVMKAIGDRIDYLSFHVYQPSEEGYRPYYDPETLYRQIAAAPLSVEDAVIRMAAHMDAVRPGHSVGIALDEWNVKLPPPPGARTMHEQEYTLRDGLYVAGMLNVFHRTCRVLRLANLAMLVNVLPAIIRPGEGASDGVADDPVGASAQFTPLAWPFVLYRSMERLALECRVPARAGAASFSAPALGLNISERSGIPWLDVTATRNDQGDRVVVGLINRHPTRRTACTVALRGLAPMKAVRCRSMSGRSPVSQDVIVRTLRPPRMWGEDLSIQLAAASLTVVELERRRT